MSPNLKLRPLPPHRLAKHFPQLFPDDLFLSRSQCRRNQREPVMAAQRCDRRFALAHLPRRIPAGKPHCLFVPLDVDPRNVWRLNIFGKRGGFDPGQVFEIGPDAVVTCPPLARQLSDFSIVRYSSRWESIPCRDLFVVLPAFFEQCQHLISSGFGGKAR